MFYLTLGYFLRTPDNSNLFSISLEGSSYPGSTVQDIFQCRVNSNLPQTGNCDLYGQRSLATFPHGLLDLTKTSTPADRKGCIFTCVCHYKYLGGHRVDV